MRPNLLARLKGRDEAPSLLLQGHIDVVPVEGQNWQHPPFEGKNVDGWVWGRGALDMKGGVAMMLAAFLRAKAEGLTLPGDVLLLVLSDEEAGGDYGAKYLVEEHAGLFDGVRYALGEFGGFPLYVGGRRFYPIQVAEKQRCFLRAVVRGPGGHGALPMRGGAMAKLARLLKQLDRRRLPVHVTPVARRFLETMAACCPGTPPAI
jgi:acetylornithine deacetylase/succinyl-diaminopimelate desuccinylase-like protein